MLRITDAGTVRHNLTGLHHAVQKPRRSVAESALVMLDEYLDDLTEDSARTRKLRKAHDILAIVVRTAY